MERFLTIYFDSLAASLKAIVGSLTCQSAQCSESPRLQALNQYQPTEAVWRTISVLQASSRWLNISGISEHSVAGNIGYSEKTFRKS